MLLIAGVGAINSLLDVDTVYDLCDATGHFYYLLSSNLIGRSPCVVNLLVVDMICTEL